MDIFKTTSTSELIYEFIYENKSLDYIKTKRFALVDRKLNEKLIERDINLMHERGKDYYIFKIPYVSLDDIYTLLFKKNLINKLTFSEQIMVIELFKKISLSLKYKENKIVKEIDEVTKTIEKSYRSFQSQYKYEYLRIKYEDLLFYYKILARLEEGYKSIAKDLSVSLGYELGVEEDILEASIIKTINLNLIKGKEKNLIMPILTHSFKELEEFKKLEIHSDEEQTVVKKLLASK